MSIVICLACLAMKLGEAVDITLDIVNTFPRWHAGLESSIHRAGAI